MSHIHNVIDTDKHYIINSITRAVSNSAETKNILFQYDHNSERFTFELPRIIDGHDMTKCNLVQIHYVNVDAKTKAAHEDVYNVSDVEISESDPEIITFSWLVSRNATQYVGNLSFIIRFACVSEDGTLDYVWNTAINSNINIASGINNTEYIEYGSYDILAELAARILSLENTDPNRHAEYFTITDDGAISLKPEYRGAVPPAAASYSYAISDNGVDKDGSKNSELPENLVIPEVVNEIAVTTLREGIFTANKAIKSITIPTHITQLPALFAWSATSLEEVKGTEQIKSIGGSVLTSTAIRKAHFPNLETMNGGTQFAHCALLVSADLGKVTEIPKKTFQFCDNLSAVHNTDGVISVGDSAFMKTNRLKNLTFLSNLTSVGNKAFLYSRVDNDWWDEKYNNTTFGSMATVRQLYTEKWWEDCTYTPCNTPMLSVFDQYNPKWRDKFINNYGNTQGDAYKYANGCGVVSAAMAYSALTGEEFAAPSEFMELVAANKGDMTINPRSWVTIRHYFTVLGCTTTENLPYNGDSDEGKNLQIMYDALANGALVLAVVDGSYASDRATHMVVIHGINANGEVLVQDPTSSVVRYLGLDKTASYAIPIQNIVGNAALSGGSSGFIIVYPKQ